MPLSRLILLIAITHYHLIPLSHIIVPVALIGSGLIHLRAVSSPEPWVRFIDILSVNDYSSVFLDNTAASSHGSLPRWDLIGSAVELIIKRLILLTQKVTLGRGQLVGSLPHFAKIRSLVMEGEELPQLSVLLLLESIIGCVQLGLARHEVAAIHIVVSSLLVLLQNVCFWQGSERIVDRSLFLPDLRHVSPEIRQH